MIANGGWPRRPRNVIWRLLCHLRVEVITNPCGVKALVFQEVTSGQVRPDHTMAPSTLKPEAAAHEGLIPGPSLLSQRCHTSPTAPQNSEYTQGVFAGYTEVEKCC